MTEAKNGQKLLAIFQLCSLFIVYFFLYILCELISHQTKTKFIIFYVQTQKIRLSNMILNIERLTCMNRRHSQHSPHCAPRVCVFEGHHLLLRQHFAVEFKAAL